MKITDSFGYITCLALFICHVPFFSISSAIAKMESLLSQDLTEKAVMEGLPHTSIPCRQEGRGREEGEREGGREGEREGGRDVERREREGGLQQLNLL